jgi:predicted dithiol-disulfide oxidoreductase (DUF899 family)
MKASENSIPLTRIATHVEWGTARKELLTKEKEFTRMQDALTADASLPVVAPA